MTRTLPLFRQLTLACAIAVLVVLAGAVPGAESGAPQEERVALRMTLRDSGQRAVAIADAVVSTSLAQKVINRSTTAIDRVLSRPSCSSGSAETETMSLEFSVNDQLLLVRSVPIRVSFVASGAIQPLSQMALTLAVMHTEAVAGVPAGRQGHCWYPV